MVEDSYEYMVRGRDRAVLVAGDGDHVPAVESLERRGFPVRCLFWGHGSRELRNACSEFVVLDPHLQTLSR